MIMSEADAGDDAVVQLPPIIVIFRRVCDGEHGRSDLSEIDETNVVLLFLGDGDSGQFDAVMIVSV